MICGKTGSACSFKAIRPAAPSSAIRGSASVAAAAIAAANIPVFAFKGESLDEYWEFSHKIFEWPEGQPANMILDDGGDVGGLFGGGTATSARTVSASSGASCTQAGRCWTG